MKFLSRVVWSEGMHLGPHHFQAQSRYFEDTLWFLASNHRQNPWGLLNFSIDAGAVRNGTAIVSFASGIMPDGLIFDVPDSDSPPAPVRLKDLFTPTDNEIVLCLAVPARNDLGLDCDSTGRTGVRYSPVQRRLTDESSGQGEFDVSFAHKNFILTSQDRLPEGSVSFALARVVRDGAGGFACDPDFIPPCLRIGACEGLVLQLHRLVQAMEEKMQEVRSARLSTGRFELGTSALDVANYWFLHALSSSIPALRHHLGDRLSHPEQVYGDLIRLAGSLSTFSLEATLDDIPKYCHNDLTATFKRLDELIRRYLEVVVPSNTVTLQFRREDRYIYSAAVTDERCLRRARWIFGIRSTIGESSLLDRTQRLVKVCSAGGVLKLVNLALPGLTLIHLPTPPSALHAQADMHYFSISLGGACWEHILQTRKVGVYVPGDLGDAVFEVTVILETSV
ncbi:MAG: type VI secretion system baseplate subunit TssK [Terracidiphilus sp.]